jgi:hypothetical protein
MKRKAAPANLRGQRRLSIPVQLFPPGVLKDLGKNRQTGRDEKRGRHVLVQELRHGRDVNRAVFVNTHQNAYN